MAIYFTDVLKVSISVPRAAEVLMLWRFVLIGHVSVYTADASTTLSQDHFVKARGGARFSTFPRATVACCGITVIVSYGSSCRGMVYICSSTFQPSNGTCAFHPTMQLSLQTRVTPPVSSLMPEYWPPRCKSITVMVGTLEAGSSGVFGFEPTFPRRLPVPYCPSRSALIFFCYARF